MRRITVIGMIILGLVALPLVAAAAPALKGKTEICHMTGDGDLHTVEVSKNALQAHINHGDSKGACEEASVDEEAGVDFTASGSCTSMTSCTMDLQAIGAPSDTQTYWWVAIHQYTGFTAGGIAPNVTDLWPGTYEIALYLDGSITPSATKSITFP